MDIFHVFFCAKKLNKTIKKTDRNCSQRCIFVTNKLFEKP